MQIQVPKSTPVQITNLRLAVPVNYDEEDIPNDFPGRTGNRLRMEIDMDSGIIKDWPQGRAYNIRSMKVRDEGVYYLFDGDIPLYCRAENYVPDFFPGNHYGDDICFNIDATGKIAGWTPEKLDIAQFDAI